MNICKNILIIANGKVLKVERIKNILYSNPSIICCDGAVEKSFAYGIEPDVVIGDMDSIDSNLKSKLSDKIVQINNQDTNDLDKALNWLRDKDVESVTIIGADGLRDDHAMGNILLLIENSYNYKIKMITEFGRFDVMNTGMLDDDDNKYSQSFHSFKRQAVSLFCIDKSIILNSEGLEYPLYNFTFTKLYDATLNVSTGENFTISCNKNNVNIIVYRANEEA